jgi:hypothetical protein
VFLGVSYVIWDLSQLITCSFLVTKSHMSGMLWLGVEWVSPCGVLGCFEVFLRLGMSWENILKWMLIWKILCELSITLEIMFSFQRNLFYRSSV